MSGEDEQANAPPAAPAGGLNVPGTTQGAPLESEQLFRSAFDDAAAGMLIVDPAGRLLRVNQAFAGMLGYTAPELSGRSFHEITHPDDVSQTEDMRTEMIEDDDAARRTIVKRYLHKDGGIRWGRLRVSAVRDADHRLLHFVTQIEDITELRKTQSELVESELLFRGAFETAVSGMTLADPEGVFLRVNATFATMLGYTPPDFVGRRIADFVHPDDRADVAAGRDTLRSGGSLRRATERRYISRGGETKLGKVSVSAIRGEDGSLLYTVAQIEDVTELRQAQRELAEGEALRRLVFEGSRDMLGIFDPDGTLQLVSPAVEVLLGHDPASLLGQNFAAFIHPDDLQPCLAAVAAALDGAPSSSFRARFRAADDSYRLFEGTVSPGRGSDGEVSYLVSNSRDVTEQVALEDQLRHAQKMEVVGRLAGGVAHDFNNLLLAIRGYAELARLAAAEGTDNTAEIDEIMTAAGRAGDLTAQLLAFSRRQVLNPVLLDLGAVVTEMVSMLRRLIHGNVELVTQLPEGPALVRADRAQMEQVIANLTVNASDAMPDGGTLTIEIGPSLDGQTLLLSVRDTGTGMDAATASQMFEPFFTTKGAGGTGLGLSMVHGIVNQSGGSIAVESTPGEGTTLLIELPLADAEELPEQTSSAPAEGGAETILLVEDDPLVQKVVALMLERHGYRIVAAASGEEAVSLAHADPNSIDLILTDLVMPGMNGRETAKALRDDQPQAKVLYMSGYTEDVVIRVGHFEPGTAFIPKPFSGEDLAHRVRELLDARTT